MCIRDRDEEVKGNPELNGLWETVDSTCILESLVLRIPSDVDVNLVDGNIEVMTVDEVGNVDKEDSEVITLDGTGGINVLVVVDTSQVDPLWIADELKGNCGNSTVLWVSG